jgi:tetratricopeptide (TPR) repeat protein
MVVRGTQSAEVEYAYRRATEIGESLGDVTALYKAKWGLWLSANVRHKTALARDRANELVDLARRSNDGDLLLEAYHCGWSTAFYRGEVAATVDLGRIGVETYDVNRHRHLGHAFGGHDPGVCAHIMSAVSQELSSDRELAKESIARALALAEALDQPNSLARALYDSAMCYQLVTDREATFAAAQRVAALAEKFGPEGLALLDRAIAAIDEPGVGFYLPEIYRLRGECLLALGRGNMDAARQAFATARDIAMRQGAVIFERRAEASLGEITNIRAIG